MLLRQNVGPSKVKRDPPGCQSYIPVPLYLTMLHVGSHWSRYHLRYNLCRSCLHRCALQHVICVPVMCCSRSRLPFIELHVSPFQPCRPQAGDTMYIQFTTKTRLLLLSIHTKTELRYDFVSIIYMFIYIMASRKTARRPLC